MKRPNPQTTAVISVRMKGDLLAQVDELARLENRTRANMVDSLLRRFLNLHEPEKKAKERVK